jgi:CNT family concentrative nucleoside transporter
MGVSGAESLNAAGNVFLGQTEAPLLVKPYLKDMTESELMALMVGGFATVSSGVMASYVAILGGDDPALRVEIARHFLTACLMSAPASFVVAKIMMPETQTPLTTQVVKLESDRSARNVVHAAANGASDGLRMALNVAAMLIVFIALVAMLDMVLVRIGTWGWVAPLVERAGMKQLDLGSILGLVFSPVAYIIGVESADCRAFGGLLGKAMTTNEFVAYISLSDLAEANQIAPRTFRLAMYSLCGFANISSIAIQIGGIGAIAPERRADLARFGLRAMFGGAIACWMTGCIAATFL